ncbi:MAG: hypothetical protein E7Z98_02720 [Olsenella sp.]|nr:hypothetical protein [Olsenella sp.]
MSSAYEGYLESVNNLVLDSNRVLDVTEDKWGHPEAMPWSLDPAVSPTLTMLSPDTTGKAT